MTNQAEPDLDKELFEGVCRSIKFILAKELDALWIENTIYLENKYRLKNGTLRIVYEKKKDD